LRFRYSEYPDKFDSAFNIALLGTIDVTWVKIRHGTELSKSLKLLESYQEKKPNKILFIVLISGNVDFSERTHRYPAVL